MIKSHFGNVVLELVIGILSILFEGVILISTLLDVVNFVALFSRPVVGTCDVAASGSLLAKVREDGRLRHLARVYLHAYTTLASLFLDWHVGPLYNAVMPILLHGLHLPFESVQKV